MSETVSELATRAGSMITIKVVTLAMGLPTLSLQIKPDAVVMDLKEKISQLDEAHPETSRQRLTYNRKELTDDNQKLCDLQPKVDEGAIFSMALELQTPARTPTPTLPETDSEVESSTDLWTVWVNHPPFKLKISKEITLSELKKQLTVEEECDLGQWSLVMSRDKSIPIDHDDQSLDMISGATDGCTLSYKPIQDDSSSDSHPDQGEPLFLELRLYDAADHISITLKVKLTDTVGRIQHLAQELFLREHSKVVPANRQKLVCNGQVKSEESPMSSFQTGDRGSEQEPLILLVHVRDREISNALDSSNAGHAPLLGDIQDTIAEIPSNESTASLNASCTFKIVCLVVFMTICGVLLLVASSLKKTSPNSGFLHYIRASHYHSSCLQGRDNNWYGTTLVKYTDDPWDHPTCRSNCRYYIDNGSSCQRVSASVGVNLPEQICKQDHPGAQLYRLGTNLPFFIGRGCNTTIVPVTTNLLPMCVENLKPSHVSRSVCQGTEVETELVDYSGNWTNCTTLCDQWCSVYQHHSAKCCSYEYLEHETQGFGCRCGQYGAAVPLSSSVSEVLKGTLQLAAPVPDAVAPDYSRAVYFRHDNRTILGIADLLSVYGYSADECSKKCLATAHCRTFITTDSGYCELWSVAPQESGGYIRKTGSYLFTLDNSTTDITCFTTIPARFKSRSDCERFFLTVDLSTPISPFPDRGFYYHKSSGSCDTNKPDDSTLVYIIIGSVFVATPIIACVVLTQWSRFRVAIS